MHHDNDVVADSGHVLDKGVTVVPESKIVPVTLIVVDGNIAFARVGIDEYDGYTADIVDLLSKCFNLSVGVVVENALNVGTVGKHFVLNSGQGRHEIREVTTATPPTRCERPVVCDDISICV